MLIRDLIDIIKPETIFIPNEFYDNNISAISYDTRNVIDNSVFFAYKGTTFDSTDEAINLYKNGKILLIVTDKILDKSIPHIVVKDVRQALSNSANAYFGLPLSHYKSVAVTGTNGKTTITYLLESIFKSYDKKTVKVGTNGVFLDNKFYEIANTTPSGYELFSYLNEGLKVGCNYFVMELSSHALEQKRVSGVKFDVAVFSNLTQDHLDYHKDMESYFKAKAILFTTDMAKHKVINIGSIYGERLVKLSNKFVITYAVNKKADIYSKSYELTADGIKARINIFDNDIEIHSSLIGLHNLENILAGVATAKILNISDTAIIAGINNLKSVAGRLQKIDALDYKIFIDYAHTDDALKNVLTALKSLPHNKLITVFGAGGDRDKGKRPLMAKVVKALTDIAIVTSDNPRTEIATDIINDIIKGFSDMDNVIIAEDRQEAIKQAISLATTDDIILIAGKGHEKYQIIGKTKYHFDDVEIVNKYIKRQQI